MCAPHVDVDTSSPQYLTVHNRTVDLLVRWPAPDIGSAVYYRKIAYSDLDEIKLENYLSFFRYSVGEPASR